MGSVTDGAGFVKVAVSPRHAAGLVRRAKIVMVDTPFLPMKVTKESARRMLALYRRDGVRVSVLICPDGIILQNVVKPAV